MYDILQKRVKYSNYEAVYQQFLLRRLNQLDAEVVAVRRYVLGCIGLGCNRTVFA